eukprot:scaffold102601_cov16-Prasinocladus_malaysianus.AAC.1
MNHGKQCLSALQRRGCEVQANTKHLILCLKSHDIITVAATCLVLSYNIDATLLVTKNISMPISALFGLKQGKF